MNSKLARSVLAYSVIGAVAYFFISRLSDSWTELARNTSFGFSAWIALALLLFMSAVVSSGVLWGKVLNVIAGERVVSAPEAARVHTGGWLLKYVPGQVGAVLYKISWGAKRRVKKIDVVWSFVYENVFLTIISVLPTALILVALGGLSRSLDVFLLSAAAGTLAMLLSKRLFERFIDFLSAKAKIPGRLKTIKFSTVAEFLLLYTIPRLINGLGFVFIAHSLFGIAAGDILPLIAAYTLAGIIGIYAIFVPSGLGVREAMIVLFVSGIFTVEQATLLALVARFYATIADGLLALLYGVLTLRKEGIRG